MTGLVGTARGIDPELWRDWASVPPVDGQRPSQFDGASLQCWTGTCADMPQPALDHHIIVLHQGGPKRVQRSGGAGRRVVDTPLNAHSTIESGSVYRWRTDGPIAFSHIYVAPTRFATIVAETFDRDSRTVSFAESIGRADPHVGRMFELMIASRNDPDWSLVADHYLDALLVRLAATSTIGGEFRGHDRLTLTAMTISRVRDFMRSNIGNRISLDDLADVAGYSRYHFVRAFKTSTGLPPYAYLLRERIAHAQEMLRYRDMPISDIARQSGFSTHTQFSTRFRETAGLTPAEYRRRHRGGAGAAATR